MTALAGIWDWRGKGGQRAALARMLGAQAIYGPHGQAEWAGGEVALGRRLYRTLPEDAYDRGPVLSADGTRCLVADVRLDNRDELERDLGLVPETTARMSDATLLMRALDRWDEKAVDRLVGDWAFALWDARADSILLGRDPLGERPLHYHLGDGFVAFASMPKGLHPLPDVPRSPDPAAAADFLAFLPEAAGRSFWTGIKAVPPGHLVTLTRNGAKPRRWWDPPRRTLRLGRPRAYEEALLETLDRAVADRLRGAGGQVGAHLSAGLDSAAVATSAAVQLAREDGRVLAFTAAPRDGYDGPVPPGSVGDESALAKLTAAGHPNVEHVEIRGDRRSPLTDLDRYFFLYERPLLNPCNGVWNTAINEAARARGVSVMLVGQMGNMSLSYAGTEHLPALLGRGRLLGAGVLAARLLAGGMRPHSVAAQALGPFLPPRLWEALLRLGGRSGGGLSERSALHGGARAAARERARAMRFDLSHRPWRDGHAMRLDVLGRVDRGAYNKGTLGGWGVDTRDPTADRRLIELCLSIPEEEFARGGKPRSLARRALAGRVPAAVLGERRRGYQGADWHEGLCAAREDLAAEIAHIGRCGPAAEVIDLPRVEALTTNWPRGGWADESVIARYRGVLLRAVSAGHFLRRAAGTN